MVLSDKNILQAALKTYASHLRGLDNQTSLCANTLQRVMDLRKKEISSNSVAVVIKLNI